MRRVFYIAGLALIFSPALAAAQTTQKLEVSGWIPYWREEQGAADALAHLDQLTEINPFVYIVQTDGTVLDAAGIADEPWKGLLQEAKKKKVRVIPTVMWSDGAAMHKILSNQKTRNKLQDDITAIAVNEGFDGVDIDFEGKWAETKDYFSLFLKGLYSRMGKKWVMCTIEARTPLDSRYLGTPPAGAGLYANNFKEINKYCDRVRLMTYDQGTIDQRLNRARGAPYIPLSDPGWVEKVVQLVSKDIPKRKLAIGIPTYGYEYEVTPLSVYGYNYDVQWSFNPRYAVELARSLGITPRRMSSGEIGFAYTPAVTPPPPLDANTSTLPIPTGLNTQAPAAVALATAPFTLLWWSDAQAIKDKVDLARRLGVRGVAVFKIDGGEDPAMWSVLR